MSESMSEMQGHRRLQRAVPLSVAVLLALGATAGPGLAAAAPVASTGTIGSTAPTTSLVPPTGHVRAGTVRLHLVDPRRVDPTSPTGGARELMVQMWYPASDTDRFPSAPYMPPLAAAHFLANAGLPSDTVLPQTIGHVGAPMDHRHGPFPVVLYSPGGGTDGALDTGLVEDLVSHGYVVVTMDDTNESPEVEFPDGRLVLGTYVPGPSQAAALLAQQTRADDAGFVLNELTKINHGGDPDAEHAPLPGGVAGALDLSQVGMFGWSLGGAASAQAMHDDPRIKAGINMDGRFWGPLAQEGADRPFLVWTGGDYTAQSNPTINSFLAASTGPKLHLALADSQHPTFSDAEELATQLASALGLSSDDLASIVGTINPTTAVTDERVYIRAFFDTYLRGRNDHLLDGPSPRYPDVTIEP